ncbi:MAG: membrane protein insertase YidC [Phycisphaerales bacterium]|nr:membrane protein insertase YidC [Phycisphaerales bacterium]
MRPPPNKFLRTLVPLAFLLAGVGIFFAVSMNSKKAMQGQPPAGTPTATSATPSAEAKPAEAPGTAVVQPAAADPAKEPSASPAKPTEPPATATASTPNLRVRKHPLPAGGYRPLGGSTPAKEGGKYELELRFSDFGAGLDRITLANHFEEVLKPEPHIVQSAQQVLGDPTQRFKLTAFSAKGLTVNGVTLSLQLDPADPASTYWREVAPGAFEAVIEDEAGEAVLTIARTFSLAEGAYEFGIAQSIANRSSQPVTVVYHDIGPIDQPQGVIRYGGDPRAVRFGFMDDPKDDPSRTVRSGDGSSCLFITDKGQGLVTRHSALGKPNFDGGYPATTLWPNAQSAKEQQELVWVGTTSRYFTVAAYAPAGSGSKSLATAQVDRVAIPIAAPPKTNMSGPFAAIGLEFVSAPRKIEPGQTAEFGREAYAGPTSKKFINAQPQASKLGLAEVVIYTFGGPCGFCTFQDLTRLLRGFLALLHDNILFDWALAIMVLVVCVRTTLHPVTKWSQVNMLRFSKNLQRLAPKQKAIQEKFKDEPMKMREEMARLMREEGVGIGAGAMGCLPAFLQTPVWIALSATLYFAFELRHQPAFFGVFQTLSGGKWGFFADLAEPDRFIPFGTSFNIPLLSGFMGPIDALNLMPILLGIVFFIQQKYMTPPSAMTMTPEQEQQQKIMKVMMVVLFPVMMYNAPSGLALYFAVNSMLAIFESRHIRRHAESKIEAEISRKAAKKAAGGTARNGKASEHKPGMFERLQKLAEQRQKMMEEAKRMHAKRDKGKK